MKRFSKKYPKVGEPAEYMTVVDGEWLPCIIKHRFIVDNNSYFVVSIPSDENSPLYMFTEKYIRKVEG